MKFLCIFYYMWDAFTQKHTKKRVKRSSHFTLISLHLFHSDGVGADLYFAEL